MPINGYRTLSELKTAVQERERDSYFISLHSPCVISTRPEIEMILIFRWADVEICLIALGGLELPFKLRLGTIKYDEFLFFLIMKRMWGERGLGGGGTAEPELIKVWLRFIESGSELKGVV